jgi:hypothetical protein
MDHAPTHLCQQFLINNAMKPIQIISQDLFDKIRSRFSNLEMGDETGAVTIEPTAARFFDFDFVREGVDLGRVSISLNDLGSLKVYYSQGITEGEDDDSKQLWYDFLKEMRFFAMRRLLRFDTRDIAKTNLDKNDFQHLAKTQGPKEEIMTTMNESQWNHKSSKKTSRAVKGRTEVIMRHHNPVSETYPGARSQRKNIKAIFIQNRDGERFKYPFIHPAGAFAMAQHVDHGGAPHDPAGKAIISISEQIAQLSEFQRKIQHQTLHDDATGITERAIGRLTELKAKIAALGKRHHYESWLGEFTEQQPMDDGLELDAVTMEDYKSKFTQKNFQEELTQFFPLIHRIMQEANKVELEDFVKEQEQEDDTEENVKEDIFNEFEQWAEAMEQNVFDIEQLTAAMEALPQPLSLADEVSVDETVRFFNEHGIQDPELEQNLKDQARIDSTADPVKEVLLPWAQQPENQEQYPGLTELLTTYAGGEEPQGETPPAEPAATEPAPDQEQPVAESRDFKKMAREVVEMVKTRFNRDNPNMEAFNGHEGILTDVEKHVKENYGDEVAEAARQVAEKAMSKMTHMWKQRHGHDYEMESILKLAGMKK